MMARYPEMLEGAAKSLEVHRITFYLNELAGVFHSYYNKNKVVTEDAALSAARLVLIDAVRIVLANALGILGVNAPEKMMRGEGMGPGNIKKFELKLGKTSLFIVVGGMTVLLCLSFVLGVEVGKNIDTYPEKISSMPQQVLALFWRPAKVASGQKTWRARKLRLIKATWI